MRAPVSASLTELLAPTRWPHNRYYLQVPYNYEGRSGIHPS